jgi:hypothetical protein
MFRSGTASCPASTNQGGFGYLFCSDKWSGISEECDEDKKKRNRKKNFSLPLLGQRQLIKLSAWRGDVLNLDRVAGDLWALNVHHVDVGSGPGQRGVCRARQWFWDLERRPCWNRGEWRMHVVEM